MSDDKYFGIGGPLGQASRLIAEGTACVGRTEKGSGRTSRFVQCASPTICSLFEAQFSPRRSFRARFSALCLHATSQLCALQAWVALRDLRSVLCRRCCWHRATGGARGCMIKR